MRFVLAMVLAGLALPLSVSAQAREEAATAEPGVQEPGRPDLTSERYGYQPPSRSKGDSGPKGHSRQAMHPAGICFLSMTGVTVLGAVVVGVGMTRPPSGDWDDLSNDIAVVTTGAVFMMVGGVGMIASGVVWGKRTRQGRRPQETHYATPRRVQWDVARSRVVF